MSEKEKTFCEYFALWGDAVRAADSAGYERKMVHSFFAERIFAKKLTLSAKL